MTRRLSSSTASSCHRRIRLRRIDGPIQFKGVMTHGGLRLVERTGILREGTPSGCRGGGFLCYAYRGLHRPTQPPTLSGTGNE